MLGKAHLDVQAAFVLAGQVILRGHGIDLAHGYPSLSLGSAPVLRATVGSVLYLP